MLNWNGITKTANFVGLDNYVEVLGDGLFWNAVKNSVLYAVAGTFFSGNSIVLPCLSCRV